MECSKAGTCVNPYPDLKDECNYNLKLQQGINYYYKDKNLSIEQNEITIHQEKRLSVSELDVITKLKSYPHLANMNIDKESSYVKKLLDLINIYNDGDFLKLFEIFDRSWLLNFDSYEVYKGVFKHFVGTDYSFEDIDKHLMEYNKEITDLQIAQYINTIEEKTRIEVSGQIGFII